MALTSTSTLADALAQYKASLRWWTSTELAADLYEAVLYLLACKPETIAVADQSVNFASLEPLRAKLESVVLNCDTSRRTASFVRGRVRYY